MNPLPDKTIVVSHRAILKAGQLTAELVKAESILIRDRHQVREYLERELSAFGQEEFSARFVNGSISKARRASPDKLTKDANTEPARSARRRTNQSQDTQ